MKNLMLIMLLGISWTSAYAQIEKGNILIGSSSNLNISRTSLFSPSGPVRERALDLSGNAGYFVLDNFVLGLSVSRSRNEFRNFETRTSSFTPFMRYFFSASIFTEFGLGFGRQINRNLVVNPDTGQSMWFENKVATKTQTLSIGYAIWITDKISIEPLISYTIQPGTAASPPMRNLGYKMGFRFYLP